jgi:hypothetical protein
MESGDVLLYCPNFNMSMKLAKALIENSNQELRELREFEDNSIIQECESINAKSQALWACRVYLHPQYSSKSNEKMEHQEKLQEEINEHRMDLIKKYFRWILFAKSREDEKDNGEIFWNDYCDFYLRYKYKYKDKEKIQFEDTEKWHLKKELVKELLKLTEKPLIEKSFIINLEAIKYSEISKKINETFGIGVQQE